MAIQALGAKPNMMLHPAQQTREEVVTQAADAGNTQVVSETESMADQAMGGDQAGLGMKGNSELQQMMHRFKDSVHEQINEVREESEINELSDEDIAVAEQEFRDNLDSIYDRAASDSSTDVGFVSNGMVDAISKLANSLKFSIEGILPPVPPKPWEASYPPDTQQDSPVQGPEDAVFKGLDELA